jgi:hypothetical protein
MGMKSVIQAVEKEIEQLNRVLHLHDRREDESQNTPAKRDVGGGQEENLSGSEKAMGEGQGREKIKRSTIVQ